MLTFARINRNIRSLKRYRQILGVLIKYGFGNIIEQLNIDYYLELGKRIVSLGTMSKKVERFSQAARLRLAMEELGPTFIKLGQILSTRPDLIPAEYTNEFRKLQDQVPPQNSAIIRQEVEQQLGATIDETFASFDDHSIAAGSIAQIHRATLFDGTDVAVKVRRTGIIPQLETDLDILAGLAYLLENHVPGMDIFDPSGIVREFRRTLFREIDLTREGHTIERFAANFAAMEEIFTPQIFWQHSAETVLTMEYVEGIKITDAVHSPPATTTAKKLAALTVKAVLQQILVHGLFHGDPHPGNIFALPDGRICFLDFGMVGRLDEELKEQLSDLVIAIVNRDSERLITQLIYSGDISDEIDRRQLKRELNELIDDYYDLTLSQINTAKLLGEFIDLLNRHRIRFPADLILLAKALVTIEGVALQLDPDFALMAQLRPQIEQLVRSRHSPGGATRDMIAVSREYGSLFRHLPQDLRELLMRINRNKFKIDLEHRGLQNFINNLDRSSNRISFSLVIASLVIGSSLVMQTDKGPVLFDFPVVGLLGYTIAGVLGLGLAIAILRSGRM